MKKCLDLAALLNETVTVPSNVTRIDNDGLALCNSSISSGGNADIVYIYDNSGSMQSTVAYVDTLSAGVFDTLYYFRQNNCTTKTLYQNNPTWNITFGYWNASGTIMGTRTVRRMVSKSGCTDASGDPFNSRGRAYWLGINNQASRAPQSTAGILSFVETVGQDPNPANGRVRTPLPLNSVTNVNSVLAGINAVSAGGTNYRPPLDSAKKWLTKTTSPVYTSHPNKAIIFLSDGSHSSTDNYLAVLDSAFDRAREFGGPMPRIFGIFMGIPQRDTVNLTDLAQRTGGQFYRIPPDRPDSLNAVVDRILDVVLLEYIPTAATITNNTLGQSASAAAPGGFTLQTNGSWRMSLDNIVALGPQTANLIRVATQFREASTGTLQNDTITFTLSTTGPVATTDSVITTQISRDCHDASRLRILRADGTRPPALTQADSAAQFRLRTAPIALATTTAQAATRLGDTESPAMAQQTTNLDSSVFQVTGPFLVTTSATANDGTLQAAQFDTLTAEWTHPRDAQDVARDTLLVRAANVAASAWFSLTEGGAAVTTYPTSQRIAYIVIQDQAADPDRVYTAMVTTIQGGLDSERVNLRVLSPGILVGQVSINSNAKVRQDGTLQVSILGDQLRVEYRDPIYGEIAVGTVGYAQEVQEAPLLVFTDENGNVLDSGVVWSPSRGKLYVRYEDDRVGGTVAAKDIGLSLASKRYGLTLGVDDERFSASLAAGSTGTRAAWTGSIDLVDAFPAIDSNGSAETRFRGEATVTAFSHDNQGDQQTTVVSDFLVIAYPDSPAVLTWSLDTNLAPGAEGLIIGVRDQDFTTGTDDSVLVTLVCARTGDSVSGVSAREIASGSYRTGTVIKDTATPNLSDRVLSCLSADQIVVRYVDPVYGTGAQLVVNEAARPVATPPGRTFAIQEIVTLSSPNPGAVIYYTLDGSTPVPGRSLVYSNPIQIDGSTVLKAIATVPGWKDSRVLVETYTKSAFASRLEILDGNGNTIPGGVLTGSATQVRFKLTTTQANLATPEVDALTRVGQDQELLELANSLFLGTSIEYSQNHPLNHGSGGAVGNDTLDARNTDTLIAVWTNPFNPLDVARDTIIIKPAFKAAEVYFTAVPNGPRITTYPDSTTVVYVVVKTTPKDPTLTYQVTISATELGLDDEVVSLVEVSPGVFTAQLPVVRGAKTPDIAGTLQVSAGADQLVAVFVDPVFLIPYRGNAGFGQDVQESASLDFIHKDGRLVAPDEFWNPTEGMVYLRYSDDWLAGIDSLVKVRAGKVNLVNRKSGNVIGTDEEVVTFTLVSQTATRGTWEGSVHLRDRAAATPANDTLETYYRGEAVATMTPHNNLGAVGGAAVTDQMVIAYPNQPAEIIIRDTSGGPVDRITPMIDIIVKDQIHTQTGDNSITVRIACEGTGDQLQSVKLVWNGTAYVADPPIRKGEGGAIQDSILQCRTTDRIVVTYLDPVYTDVKTGDVRWSDQKPARLYFASLRDSSVITSASDGVDNTVLVIVEGLSPTRDLADTIDVILTTNQSPKDSLKVRAVETGPMTGVFKVEVAYEFITRPADPGNGRLEANINADVKDNRVIVTATAVIDGSTVKADLALFSAYNLVVKAWIKDENGDGRADKAYFAFDKKLARLPSSLEEVAWNLHDVDSHRQKAVGSMLSFLTPDSNVVVADFTKSQFGANLTDIPSGAKPYGLFPSDNVFGGQRALLADSVGPVPVTAVKKPSNLASYSVSDTEKRFYPDTLVITVSERLRTTTGWSDLTRFSKGCAPYSESVPLRLTKEAEPTPGNPLEWTLTVDNSPSAQIPLVGDCIFLETDGRYLDLPGNRPSPLGIPLTGENPNLVIRDFRGFPPVAGMDPGSAGFVLVTNDVKGPNSDGRWSTQTGNGSYQVIWIPPVGLEECNGEKDILKCLEKKVPAGNDAKATPMRDIENQSFTSMPVQNLSAVQVIATGRYIARVNIYDNFGVHVRSFVQAFGYWGEEKNPWRATEKGLRSFIVWDLKDKQGQMAGQGVYVWKVNFSFSDKKSEVMYTRTGVMRN